MFTFLNRLLHASIILLTAASLSFLHISSILYTSSFLTHLEVGFRRLISVVPICSIYTNLNIYIYTFDNRHSLYFSTSAPSPGRIRGSPCRGRVLTATLDPDHPPSSTSRHRWQRRHPYYPTHTIDHSMAHPQRSSPTAFNQRRR